MKRILWVVMASLVSLVGVSAAAANRVVPSAVYVEMDAQSIVVDRAHDDALRLDVEDALVITVTR